MPRNVGCIVEGHGDVPAARHLLRRISAADEHYDLLILQPHRVPRNQLVKPGPEEGQDLDRVLALQAARVGSDGLVVVLVDSDDDDPTAVKSVIRSAGMRHDCWILPVAATREYEAWFLAGIESLRTHTAVRDDATYVRDPEGPRDAKGVLERQMVMSYKETLHQPAFTAALDLSQAARATHFATFRAAFQAWLNGTEHPDLSRR